ncbi:MAG TPA: alkaline phosphatase family protein, partial [Polyangia bacterium]
MRHARALIACALLGGCNAQLDAGAGNEEAAVSGSAIRHVVVIVQENHSFDNYFGTWCTAAPGSSPSCNNGPGCCEAAPAVEPGSGTPQITLTDAENGTFDPNETQACQVDEIDGGRMDRYVTASCGHTLNFSFAPASLVAPYRSWAQQYALADRYFQPVAGASSSNDMYLAAGRFMFVDDVYEPRAIGHGCSTNQSLVSYSSKSLGDLLDGA